MNSQKNILVTAALGLGFLATSAQAHMVGLGWSDLGGGLVQFDALHWHGAQTAASVAGDYMIIDGTNYYFTSVTNNAGSMTGLSGALVNSSYSSFSGNTLFALGTLSGLGTGPVDDWMHVVVALSGGTHTMNAPFGSGGLTSWTLNNNISTATFSLPDSGSTLAFLGLAMLGLVRFSRKA